MTMPRQPWEGVYRCRELLCRHELTQAEYEAMRQPTALERLAMPWAREAEERRRAAEGWARLIWITVVAGALIIVGLWLLESLRR